MVRQSRRALLVSGVAMLSAGAGCLWGEGDTESQADTNPAAANGTKTRQTGESGTTAQATPAPPNKISANWPLPDYSFGRASYTPETAGPVAGLGELWRLDAGEWLSTPVVSDGVLYVVGQSGTVLAVDAVTGDRRWERSLAPIGRSVAVRDGIYVRTSGTLHALDTAGAQRWQVDSPDYREGTIGPDGVYYLERRYGATLVVGLTHSGDARWEADIQRQEREEILAGPDHVYAVAGTAPEVVQFDSQSGEAQSLDVPGGIPTGLTASDGELYHVDLAGNLHAPDWWRNVAQFGISAPRIGPERVYVAANDDRTSGVYALDRTDGREHWNREATGDVLDFVITTDSLIARTPTSLFAVAVDDGTRRWSRTVPEVRQANLAVVDDVLYVSHAEGLVAYRGTNQ